jgi:WD40 repeat protein
MTGHEFPLSQCAWSPGGTWIASATIYGGVRIWDGMTGAPIAALDAEKAGRSAFSWFPEGGRIAYPGPGNSLTVWDVEQAREFSVYFAEAEITAFSVSPDGTRLAVGDLTGNLYFLRVLEGARL